jgi:uncharacterized protein (DUF58 family)
VGLDTSRNVAHQAFTFLAALLALAALAVRLRRPTVRLDRTLPRFATVGTPLPYRLSVVNDGAWPLRGAWVVEALVAPPEAGSPIAHPRRLPLPDLLPGATADLPAELVPLRRGRLSLRGAYVLAPEPLGLLHAVVRQPAPGSLLVLPRRYPLPPIALPGLRAFQAGGPARTTSVADAEEFVGLRDYRPGDPLRRIHAKSWARAGKPVVMEFEEEFLVRHALVLDTFVGPGPVLEAAVSVAASFALTASTQESLLDLLFVADAPHVESAGRGLGPPERLLELLAGVAPSGPSGFRRLGDLVLSHRERLSGCICVLTAWDADRRALVRALGRRGVETLALVVTDDRPGGAVAEADGEPAPAVRFLHVGRLAEELARL